MVAVGAAKAMKTLASNGLFTDFPIARSTKYPHRAALHNELVRSLVDAADAEPDAAKRAELLDLCITYGEQAQLLRRWPARA